MPDSPARVNGEALFPATIAKIRGMEPLAAPTVTMGITKGMGRIKAPQPL